MWRFSTQDISLGAQEKLVVPANGRILPIKRSQRKLTNPVGCLMIMLAWALIGFTFVVPYAIGNPDDRRLTYGTDYNGKNRRQISSLFYFLLVVFLYEVFLFLIIHPSYHTIFIFFKVYF
jgi:hypothetical protein